jgi:putative transposase
MCDNHGRSLSSRTPAAYLEAMGRIRRSDLPNGFFHVWTRGVATTVAFPTDADKNDVFRLIGFCSRRWEWELHAACVMSTHYHLVLEARVPELSTGMHYLNWRYARDFNVRNESFGHVFAHRFKSKVIDSEEYVFDCCAYVLQNPVKAGLCERVEDWPWSYSRYGLAWT